MQVCTSLQTDNHASTPPLGFLQAGCPSCRPTNSVKALKDTALKDTFVPTATDFHTNWIPLLSPNQQHQSTKAKLAKNF